MTNDENDTKPEVPMTSRFCLFLSELIRHLSSVIRHFLLFVALASTSSSVIAAPVGATVFEAISAHHHIRVYDHNGARMLSFDGSMETRMSLSDPSQGHFEYTEHFHMPWLWNGLITNVLVIGLGGASTQRSYQRYSPQATVETVEIDPVVLRVATNFFHFKESPRQIVHISDGRVFLRRTQNKYGAILMDAYVQNRYGSAIPYHLATKEFFVLASDRLVTNGVMCYNVLGSMQSSRADLVGAIYKTMKSVFPQVYSFPSRESQNVVLLATRSPQKVDFNTLHQRAAFLIHQKRVTLPTFRERVYAFRGDAPPGSAHASVLTDDFAPVDGLLRTGY
jgi:spermidine synthase